MTSGDASSPLRGVILHAAEDELFRARLDIHLNVIKDRAQFWSLSKIVPGHDRRKEVKRHIEQADILVLLLSTDFLASEEWSECKAEVQRAQTGGAHLFPIRLRPCLWEASEFGGVQLLPRIGEEIGRPDNDKSWVTVCQEIKALLDGRRWRSVPPPTNRASVPTLVTVAAVPVRSRLRVARILFGATALGTAGVGLFTLLTAPPPPPPGPAPHPTVTSSQRPTPSPTPPPSDCPEGMIQVPGGTFRMGGTEVNQMPHRNVQVRTFCLDRTEVTVARYEKGVASGKCPPAGTSANCNAPETSRREHPMNCVRAADAEACCQFRAARLPTEAEWEYSARSGGDDLYPWGSEAPDPTKSAGQQKRVCWRGEVTCDVTQHPDGRTVALKFFGMAGNVAEWVADSYANQYDPAQTDNPLFTRENSPRVIRGGSFASENSGKLRAAYRGQYSPTGRLDHVGFRCAASMR